MSIQLPSDMAIGLILPLSMISLDTSVENWSDEWTPQATLIDEVNWPEFFRQTGIRLEPRTFGERFFFRDLQRGDITRSEVLDALMMPIPNLTGIIIRLDVAIPDDTSCITWKNFYGYCETFAGVEETIQTLISLARCRSFIN